MGAPVEKFNPLKSSALSRKRESAKGSKWGKEVEINEITLEDVRQDAIQFGLASDVLYQMKAGKEASIFLASWKGHPILLKAYRFWLTSQASKKKGVYAPVKMEGLASKEYEVLLVCFTQGMNVPTPIGRVGNYLTMRLIGDGPKPAPQLKDVRLEEPELALDLILDQYLIMYKKANFLHGDFSAYNILWWNDKPWIIDMPQALHIGPWTDMKEAVSLLRRDIINLLSYFKKYYNIRRDPDFIVDVFLSEYVPDNLRHYAEDVGVWIK
ncbi:MAG: RIO1 family regulatory kinase/ATPase [Candidatus Thorarchaeota archaeon]